MTHIESLQFLIEKASAVAGSENKLAKQLGIKQQHVNDWKRGKRTATPEDQALLAAIAGFDPQETLVRATVEKWEGKPKGDLLMRALGKGSLAIGAAVASAGAAAHPISSTIVKYTMYIASKLVSAANVMSTPLRVTQCKDSSCL